MNMGCTTTQMTLSKQMVLAKYFGIKQSMILLLFYPMDDLFTPNFKPDEKSMMTMIILLNYISAY